MKRTLIVSFVLLGFVIIGSLVLAADEKAVQPKYCLGPWLGGSNYQYGEDWKVCYERADQWNAWYAPRMSYGGYPLARMDKWSEKPCRWGYYYREIYINPGERGAEIYCPPLEDVVKFTTNAPTPPEELPINSSFSISWEAPFAHECVMNGKAPEVGDFTDKFQGKTSEIRGSRTYTQVQRNIYHFKLLCKGYTDNEKLGPEIGSVQREFMVFVGDIPPPPTVDLQIEPQQITKGETATLTWESENAIVVNINKVGRVKAKGSVKINPQVSTVYIITAGGEFPELGLARKSVTLKVVSASSTLDFQDEEVPPDVEATTTPTQEKPKIDLKVNGQDGPMTVAAPANLTLSWNLDNYCITYGSWVGITRKAGSEQRTVKKAGVYTYKIYCPTVGTDEVKVTVTGGTGTGTGGKQVAMPIAEAGLSLDGINFSKTIRVIRGQPVTLWLSASADINADKMVSRDETNGWGNFMASGGKCQWNADLNQGTPVFDVEVTNPIKAEECDLKLGELTFYDKPGVYTYGLLQLIQNNGKFSNIAIGNIVVNEPPIPKGPPVIDLTVNNQEDSVVLAAPAEYDLVWKVINADTCVASGNWGGDKFFAGFQHFVSSEKEEELVYTLTCKGKLGETAKSINVRVAELPVCDFSATPTVIDSQSAFNRQSVLEWKCQFANTCSISPEVGEVQTFGSTRVTPQGTTNYDLTCQNLEGKSSFGVKVEVK